MYAIYGNIWGILMVNVTIIIWHTWILWDIEATKAYVQSLKMAGRVLAPRPRWSRQLPASRCWRQGQRQRQRERRVQRTAADGPTSPDAPGRGPGLKFGGAGRG